MLRIRKRMLTGYWNGRVPGFLKKRWDGWSIVLCGRLAFTS